MRGPGNFGHAKAPRECAAPPNMLKQHLAVGVSSNCITACVAGKPTVALKSATKRESRA